MNNSVLKAINIFILPMRFIKKVALKETLTNEGRLRLAPVPLSNVWKTKANRSAFTFSQSQKVRMQ